MDKTKLLEIVKNYEDKNNKTLQETLGHLSLEFEETKSLIIKLTKHLESVEHFHNVVLSELKKRGL